MLRRFLLSISLVFLFALGQQGAVLHEISHYSDISQNSQRPSNKAPHSSSVCDKCISYGELASALAVSAFATPLLAAGYVAIAYNSDSHSVATLPSYSARAPPLLA